MYGFRHSVHGAHDARANILIGLAVYLGPVHVADLAMRAFETAKLRLLSVVGGPARSPW